MGTLNRLFIIALTTITLSFSTQSFALPIPMGIDHADVLRYETALETQAQSLTHSVIQNNPATVLIDVEYSTDAEKIQTYEEIKAVSHLPGLPEVIDPHLSNPGESPISALVRNKKLKIIFENSLNTNEKRILREVLSSKLKMNSRSGDSIVLESLNVPAPKNPPLNQTEISLIAVATLMIALFAVRRKNKNQTPLMEKAVNAKNNLNNTLTRVAANQANSQKGSGQPSTINLILESQPVRLRKVIQSESTTHLARALLNTPPIFMGALLNICTQEQRKEILSIWNRERSKITPEQSQFARILIAAKLRNGTQKPESNSRGLLNFNLQKFITAKREQENLKQDSKQKLLDSISTLQKNPERSSATREAEL